MTFNNFIYFIVCAEKEKQTSPVNFVQQIRKNMQKLPVAPQHLSSIIADNIFNYVSHYNMIVEVFIPVESIKIKMDLYVFETQIMTFNSINENYEICANIN